MKKNRLLIGILVALGCIVLSFCFVTGTRYSKYKNIIGTYEIVDGDFYNTINFKLYKWTFGKQEDLKCNLYDCTGYKEGKYYSIEGSTIKFKGFYDMNYSIKEENNETYLILTSTTWDGVVSISKYKKVK